MSAKFAPGDDYLWRNLFNLPYFRGLLRAVEASYYDDLTLKRPVLDLGCGDGIFAELSFDQVIDVGIDPWTSPLREARHSRAYELLVNGLGAQLPFDDKTFETVISNSVLEHIPDLEPVVAEVNRVLKPSGTFIFCVPNDNFLNNLGISVALQRAGLRGASASYRSFFNRISRHHHCDSQAVWQDRLERHGFEVLRAWDYFSPAATRVLECGHYLGLPALVSKKLFGRWLLSPTKWNLAITRKLTEPYYLSDQKTQGGSYSFYVARKR